MATPAAPAATAADHAPTKKRGKTRAERKKAQREAAAAVKLKTVVRRLPPNLPEEIFWQSVQPWVTEESVTWRKFYPGKITKKYNKENVPSRAYIAFRDAERLTEFSRAYDGHTFRDKAGNESYAVVEFAPFQKVPSEKKKQDNRMGTIEKDEDFISFLSTLNAPPPKPSEADTLETLIASSHPVQQPKSTPLLEALRAEKQAMKDRETILKAHAHYRDQDRAEISAKRRGKQPAAPVIIERAEAAPPPAAQGKRKHGRGGKKADATPAEVPAPKDIAKPAAGKAPPPKQQPKAATNEPPAPPPEPAKETPRASRPRPPPGLGATRQFEAALSGAGVLMGGGRARRERDKETKPADKQPGPSESAKVAADVRKDAPAPQTPVSPGRNRGGRRRGDSTKSQAGPVDVTADPRTTPKLGLLHLQPEGTKAAGGQATEQAPPQAAGQSHAGEGRGRRRGRGRGRGRGGEAGTGAGS